MIEQILEQDKYMGKILNYGVVRDKYVIVILCVYLFNFNVVILYFQVGMIFANNLKKHLVMQI